MPSTVKNKGLVRIYETFADTFYYQLKESNTVGSFTEDNKETESSDRKERNKDSNPK